jgi:hypothetical protein
MTRRNTWILIALAALLLTGGGVAYVYYSQRGLRNNNPGNIELEAGQTWQGQLTQAQVEQAGGTWDGTFVQFDTMLDGVRALILTLSNYINVDGVAPDVSDIITRWSETDQAAYIADVSAALGVQATDTLTMDSATYIALAQAITTQENGANPIDISVYQQAASEAGVPA